MESARFPKPKRLRRRNQSQHYDYRESYYRYAGITVFMEIDEMYAAEGE